MKDNILMKAVAYSAPHPITHPKALIDVDVEKPVAKGRDLLVRVEAISVNPVDTKIRRNVSPDTGQYKILGWDAAGIVESIGDEVSLFSIGDKVWYAGAIDRQGANSDYHLVDERIVAKTPGSLSFAEAAAMPLTSITAWEILFERFKLLRNQTGSLLIIGGAGGVGSMMIQLAKQLTNLNVIATASRTESESWIKSLGADVVINHQHLLSEELEKENIFGVDFIASLTSTSQHLKEIIQVIKPQGSLAVIDDPGVLDIMPFKRKSISIHWEFMFTRSLYQTTDMIEQHRLLSQVAELIDAGKIKTTINEKVVGINARNLMKAHQMIESGKSIGKIVLVR